MSELIIRRFKEDDLDKAYNMIQKALSTAVLRKVYEESKVSIWRNVYTKQYIKGFSLLRHLYVAELDNDIVGTCTIHKDFDKGYISCVYINPDIQGKGIGRSLIEKVLSDEVCNEVDVVYLHAVLSATKFYKKMGFDFIEEIPTIICDSGIEVVHMEKTVSHN